LDVHGYRKELDARPRPDDVPEDEWRRRLDKLEFARVDEWLDLRPAARHLADGRLARIVRDGIAHFAGVRYDVFAYVVMPSHMHWIFRARSDWVESEVGTDDRTPREIIMHRLKRFTGLKCNEVLGSEGAFWQAESYDHCVRDEDEFLRCIAYVENNPVKAGFVRRPEDWVYSSAHERRLGQRLGAPLFW